MRRVFLLSGLLALSAALLLWLGVLFRPSATAPEPELAMIRRLREAGDYEGALRAARELERGLLANSHTPAWRREDATRLVETCAHTAALPESARAALSAADQVDSRFDGLMAAGRYRRAHALVAQQLATRRRLLGEWHPETVASLVSLAQVRYARGDRGGNLELLQTALDARRRLLGEHHPALAESEAALGRAEKQLWHLERADSLELAALELRRKLFGEVSRPVAESLIDLSDVRRSQKKHEAALAYLRRALVILRKLKLERDPEYVRALAGICLLNCFQDDWRSAERNLLAALKAEQSCSESRIESRAFINSLLGGVLATRGAFAEAEKYTFASLCDYEATRREALPGYPPSNALTDWWLMARCQLVRGDTCEAWTSVERGINRALLDGLFPPDSAEARDPVQWDAAEHRRFCTLAQVQQQLTPTAAIVGWLECRHKSEAWSDYPFWGYVIRSTGPVSWAKIEAPPGVNATPRSTTIERFASTFYTSAAWPLRAPASPDFDRIARAAYAERIAPLLPFLTGVDRLLVVNGGSSTAAPLEAFVDSAGALLGDRFVVSYIPSATCWIRMRARAHRSRPTERWNALLVRDETVDRSAAGSPLPAAREEVSRIGELFSRSVSVTTESATIMRRLARSDSLRQFDLIHVATHTDNPMRGPMSAALVLSGPNTTAVQPGSGTGANSRPNGSIRADEILSEWRLDADLFTVSCCRDVAVHAPITDPTSGLSDALFRVGARSVLSPLCAVEDSATALLMRRFYEDLTGSYHERRSCFVGVPMSKARALQEAKRYVREYSTADGTRPFANPVYWASFQLLGDADDVDPAASADFPGASAKAGR